MAESSPKGLAKRQRLLIWARLQLLVWHLQMAASHSVNIAPHTSPLWYTVPRCGSASEIILYANEALSEWTVSLDHRKIATIKWLVVAKDIIMHYRYSFLMARHLPWLWWLEPPVVWFNRQIDSVDSFNGQRNVEIFKCIGSIGLCNGTHGR